MKAEDKRAKKELEALDKTFAVNFQKRELIILNNILMQKEFRVGDVLVIIPILDKIRPFIMDTMRPPVGEAIPQPPVQEPAPNNVVTSTKEELKN